MNDSKMTTTKLETFKQGEFEWGTFTDTGVILKPDIPEPEWQRLTERAANYFLESGLHNSRASMILADLLAHGDKKFHQTYGQAIDATKEFVRLHIGNLQRWTYVAGKVPPEVRQSSLSLAHHEEVVGLEHGEQESYLRLAVDEGLTHKELRARIQDDHKKPKRKKKAKAEVDPDSPQDIEKEMIRCSNWCSAHFDEMTSKMLGPLKKFAEIYKRKSLRVVKPKTKSRKK